MEIRRITDDELEKAREICFVAFEFAIDGQPTPERSAQQIRTNPSTRMKQDYKNTLAAFDDSGEMTACLSHCTCTARMDGHKVAMVEVGDVAALPVCQGKGVMKSIFHALLEDCYDRRVPFSYLYPFSGSYYSQFGYSYCVENTIWTLRLEHLPVMPDNGTCQLYSTCRLADLAKIYESFTQHRNLSVCREHIEWHSLVGRFNPAVDQVFTYIYYNEQQQPLGYLTYRKELQSKKSTICCSSFVYTCREGLCGLLSFLRGKKAYYDYAEVRLPSDIDLSLLLPEFSLSGDKGSSGRRSMHGMVRVVHLEEAVKSARFDGDGEVSLQIEDFYLPHNAGRWRLRWNDGRCTSIIRQTIEPDGPADCHMDIALFSRLLCGGLSETVLSLLPDGTFTCDNKKVLALFPQKRVGSFEFF